MREKPKVAFICVHNSCRSQIAETTGQSDEVFRKTIHQIEQRVIQLKAKIQGGVSYEKRS